MLDLSDLPLDGYLIRTIHGYDYTSIEPPEYVDAGRLVRVRPVCGEPFDVPADEVVGYEVLPAG